MSYTINTINTISTMSTLLSNGFVILQDNAETPKNRNILSLLKKLESRDIVLSKNLVLALVNLDEQNYNDFKHNILLETKSMKGQFLKESFASGNNLDDEQMTFGEALNQYWQYFYVYGLGVIPEGLFEEFQSRKIEVKDISKKSQKQKINNTYRIIDVKSPSEFILYINSLVESPIVLGKQHLDLIAVAKELNLLDISKANIKVKENLFAIVELLGKEIVKEQSLLKTSNDILRYANFVSGADYRTFNEIPRYNISTSDKKVIMSALNKINIQTAYEEMKPRYSFWLALSRNLFPGSKKFNKFKNAQEIFFILRNGKMETFNSTTEEHIRNDDMIALTKHLSKKPGELLRRLDMIIRKAKKGQTKEILKIVSNVELNPKLILQVKKWIEYRSETKDIERIVSVKGKAKTLPKQLEKLKEKRASKVISTLENKLTEHFVNKELF